MKHVRYQISPRFSGSMEACALKQIEWELYRKLFWDNADAQRFLLSMACRIHEALWEYR